MQVTTLLFLYCAFLFYKSTLHLVFKRGPAIFTQHSVTKFSKVIFDREALSLSNNDCIFIFLSL